jgi:hypothetical protein
MTSAHSSETKTPLHVDLENSFRRPSLTQAVASREAYGAEDDDEQKDDACCHKDLDLHILPPHLVSQAPALNLESLRLALKIFGLVDENFDTFASLQHLHTKSNEEVYLYIINI